MELPTTDLNNIAAPFGDAAPADDDTSAPELLRDGGSPRIEDIANLGRPEHLRACPENGATWPR
jgi:hypothetical protein